MNDEERLRERLREQVATAPVVGDLDDLSARIGRRTRGRERPLVAVALAALVFGTIGGFAAGRVSRNASPAVTVSGVGSSTSTSPGPVTGTPETGELGVMLGAPTPWQQLFVRTTADGVTVRAYLSEHGSFLDVEAELSTNAAVTTGGLEDTPSPASAIGALSGSRFGIPEGAPTQWVIAHVRPDVTEVRVTFGDNGTDEMQPEHGIAMLAHLGDGTTATVDALDAQGHVLQSEDVPGATTCIKTLLQCAPSTPTTPVSIAPVHALPAPGAEQPSDPVSARAAITLAFAGAFEGAATDAQHAQAVEGGTSLISVFDEIRNGPFGAQAAEAKTVIDGIVFVSATSAAVEFHSDLGPNDTSGPYFADAKLTTAGWQVTRASYCQIVIAADGHCP